MSTSEFAILGGGIAGLTAGIALKKLGINAPIFESSAELRTAGAGLVMAPNAINAFAHVGIADSVIAAGHALEQLEILNQKGKKLGASNVQEIDPSYHYITIHRADLHEVLMDQLNPDQLVFGARSKNIMPIKEGYQIRFENGLVHNCNYLIIAEGIHSAIRQQLFPEMKMRYSGYSCWRGITSNAAIKAASETWGTKGRFGIVPLKNDQVYWFAVVNCQKNGENYPGYTPEQIAGHFKGYHAPVEALVLSTPAEHIIWNDISDLEPGDHLVKDRVCFIGDAIHATTPNMGQGACMAIEDAAVLANCLSDQSDITKAFEQYESKRLKRVHFIVNQSWKIGKVAQNDQPIYSSIRNWLLSIVPASVKRKQLRKVIDFKVNGLAS